MIQITPMMRVLVAVKPADFRRGIDGMARLCRAELAQNPFSGVVFVFLNRRRTGIKILVYDGQGFWLCYKRLSAGKFPWRPAEAGKPVSPIEAHELQILLRGGDPSRIPVAPEWRSVRG